jgi:hypothetical protein
VANYLPEEVIQPVRGRQVLATWIGALALVLACNFLLAPRLLEGGRNLAGWIISHKWRMLLGMEQPVDDLILGDSSCNQGVNPAELTRALGDKRAVNLCTIGDMLALNDAWMLQTYIERFGAPKRVIIVHVYDIWSRSFDWNRVGTIPVGLTRLRRLEPEVTLKRWQLRSYMESRYFPLYTNNRSLQSKLRLGDPALELSPGPRRVNPLGFLADSVAFPDSVTKDFQAHLEYLAKNDFKLSRDNARGLAAISALAREHNFPVYLAPAPMYDSLAGNERFRRYYSGVHEALAQASTGNMHLLFDQPMVFPASELQNADHLVVHAANRYTRALAERIRAIEKAAGNGRTKPIAQR